LLYPTELLAQVVFKLKVGAPGFEPGTSRSPGLMTLRHVALKHS